MQQFFNNILFVVKSCIDLNVQYMYIYVVYNLGFLLLLLLCTYACKK